MKSLISIDFRRNGLIDLPSSVSKWSKVEYLYLAGNPLCADDVNIPSNLKGAKGLCEQQCSADCPAHWLGRYGCMTTIIPIKLFNYNVPMNLKPKPNSGCNTAACEYDKGDCPR